MSIKSDRWIRRMAREHGMIEPFDERQVRQTDAQGRRVISYGVSRYGYDMRVAPEFKIFTNVLSAIVDPKEFDARSFVRVRGRRLHRPAEQLRAGPLGGVLPDSAQRASRSASARAPTRAAASSPTSRRSSPSGRVT